MVGYMRNMVSYELALVAKTSLSDAAKKKLAAFVKSLLKDFKITKENEIGEKPLAYKIKKTASGSYWDFWFEGDNTIGEDFEKKLFTNEDILRHLVLRKK